MTTLKRVIKLFNTNRRGAKQIIKGWNMYNKWWCKKNERKASRKPLEHMGRLSGRGTIK